MQVTVLREPVADRDLHNHTPRRSVRFNDSRNEFSHYNVPDWQNDYGEARVIGSVSPANISGQFQYSISVVKPCLLPIGFFFSKLSVNRAWIELHDHYGA